MQKRKIAVVGIGLAGLAALFVVVRQAVARHNATLAAHRIPNPAIAGRSDRLPTTAELDLIERVKRAGWSDRDIRFGTDVEGVLVIVPTTHGDIELRNGKNPQTFVAVRCNEDDLPETAGHPNITFPEFCAAMDEDSNAKTV